MQRVENRIIIIRVRVFAMSAKWNFGTWDILGLLRLALFLITTRRVGHSKNRHNAYFDETG